ncbi:hypothetical protein GCM10023205_32860 [Yinghuangia aomiensis]|uniref:Uncharacterized protein n=1 Tax=Yinghuangia aomiensis TaxID=676205 RepID=A0ABP9HAS8_9ACTN
MAPSSTSREMLPHRLPPPRPPVIRPVVCPVICPLIRPPLRRVVPTPGAALLRRPLGIQAPARRLFTSIE